MLVSAYSGIPNKKLANGCPVFTSRQAREPGPETEIAAGY